MVLCILWVVSSRACNRAICCCRWRLLSISMELLLQCDWSDVNQLSNLCCVWPAKPLPSAFILRSITASRGGQAKNRLELCRSRDIGRLISPFRRYHGWQALNRTILFLAYAAGGGVGI